MPKAKTAQSRAETTEQQAPSGAGNKENSPLQFDVRIQSIRPGESIKGTASVNINGAFAIQMFLSPASSFRISVLLGIFPLPKSRYGPTL